MTEGEPPEFKVCKQRLDVTEYGFAGGGVAHVAEGHTALQPVHDLFGFEIVGHVTEAAMAVKMLAVEGYKAGGFLAAMLEGM